MNSIFLLAALSLLGLYGEPHLTLELAGPAAADAAGKRVLFFAFVQVHRPAKGLAAFPDGGRPKVLYKNVSLYQMDIADGALKRLYDFGPLPLARSAWNCRAFYEGDSVRFNLEPVSGWQQNLKWKRVDTASYQKYHTWFVIDPATGLASPTEPAGNAPKVGPGFPLSRIKQLAENIAWRQWGIELDSICPAGKKERIGQLTGLKGNQNYRDALVEQFYGRLEKNGARKIVSKIRKDRPGSLAAKETVDKLRKIFLLEDE
ncbi:MAG: hypothetical protein KJ620_05685 [Candidatus Edwardsbacteria bacterium]|nr:hypothetical protein [Candidatus Edwardsbacteria bacterium]MBU1575912.1 hypothetical protein [Candidatus Edwardsbacteria bacterium]MBU2464316.1 hypothetical protein [Candidatus Edwardsbacteria bacterium]MBU2593125.1 hypothetical protein [Candidatus Edwardsbacteria bacterium]